jgi:hypothetical protein
MRETKLGIDLLVTNYNKYAFQKYIYLVQQQDTGSGEILK